MSNIGQQIAECEQADFEAEAIPTLTINWPHSITEIKFIDWSYDETDEILTLSGEQNEFVVLEKVPLPVVALRIAGHNVLEKWLRERQLPYLKRNFNNADAEELVCLISRINTQFQLISSVDPIVREIINSENLIDPQSVP